MLIRNLVTMDKITEEFSYSLDIAVWGDMHQTGAWPTDQVINKMNKDGEAIAYQII